VDIEGGAAMTAADLLELCDRLEELRAKATPGEWRFSREDDVSCGVVFVIRTDDKSVACAGCNSDESDHCPELADEDCDLILAAVNALPALIAGVQEMAQNSKALEYLADAYERLQVDLEAVVGECGAHGSKCSPSIVDRVRKLKAEVDTAERRGFDKARELAASDSEKVETEGRNPILVVQEVAARIRALEWKP